jgi:hypothetical protein
MTVFSIHWYELSCGIKTRLNASFVFLIATIALFSTLTMVIAAESDGKKRQTSFPCTVKVRTNDAYLRCGPGDDYYPTERLSRGSSLDIWAIDTSGYCAVRPVEGSFSWVRASEIEDDPSDPRLGVIVADGAIARIGSQINPLRHVTQIRLEAGERVVVIEQVRIDQGRHVGLWYRIEPPAGEFRFARLRDLNVPAELLPPQPVDETDVVALVAGEMPSSRPVATAPPVLQPAPGGWFPQGAAVFDPAARVIPPVAVSGTMSSGDELADIDLALSLAVSGPVESWNLATIAQRIETAKLRTASPVEKVRADSIALRIAKFEEIHSRHMKLAVVDPKKTPALRLGGMWSSLGAIGSRPIRPGVLPGGAPADGRPNWTPLDTSETTGRLATVISRRPEAPRWALVDENNQVLVFVTPSESVNLAPLVGQQVSIKGQRGYMPEYRRPYVVASEARPRLAKADVGTKTTPRQ